MSDHEGAVNYVKRQYVRGDITDAELDEHLHAALTGEVSVPGSDVGLDIPVFEGQRVYR